MKTYYQVTLICELGSQANLRRFETLTSLYLFFHEYLKNHDYDLSPNVFVTRYWQLKNRYYTAGTVEFHFDRDPKDYRNNRWIKNKIRSSFDGDWVFNYSLHSFMPYVDNLHFLRKVDFRKWKVSVHDNEELPF